MTDLEAILVLLTATTILVAAAQRLSVPYPALLVLGGLAIGFVPGMANIDLKPEYVFILILPPILQSAAFFTPIRDLRSQIRPILSLAVGLVLVSTCVVAVIAHWIVDDLTWPAAFVLGAVVSPPDAVAATSIASRLRLPRRLVTVLEGESLFNDASALVSYRVAVAAGVTGAFSLQDAVGEFGLAALGGIAFGLAAGRLITFILLRISDGSILIVSSVIAPYATYIVAEHLHVSGVLAVVVQGLMIGSTYFRLESAEIRIQSLAFWKMFIFLLNGFVFILMGIQLPDVLDGVDHMASSTLLLNAAVVCVAVIVVRILWLAVTTVPRVHFRHRPLACSNTVDSRETRVIMWAGMRGAVSLAMALALPVDFPARHQIIFLTFTVILATLVVQGLTLAPLIRALDIRPDDGADREERQARKATAQAALDRLDELAREEWAIDAVILDLASHLNLRMGRLGEVIDGADGPTPLDEVAGILARLQVELIHAEMREAIRLRDVGQINDETLRVIQRELDLERLRLERA